jgi:hypothetical protein
MKNLKAISSALLAMVCSLFFVTTTKALTLTNPIVFVTQPPMWHELNGSVSNAFLSVVTIFGNQQADTAHAGRGGDLWLMTTNQTLVNLTRKGGLGTNGIQHGIGIDVRDPQIHWSGTKVLFSMVVGAPTNSTDTTQFYWQLYEITNLDAVIANPSTATPAIVKIAYQPTNYNNVTPCYATDGRIIFMSDLPYNNQPWLYPALDEYKGQPTVSGIYSLDPITNDFKMIEHLPSGAFNPFIDSFGRLIVTRWDHLSQDPIAADDRLGITNLGSASLNGSFNFLTETPGSLTQSTNIIETFPEPRKFDTNYDQALGVNGVDFNLFLPWAIDQIGGNEEVLNHVGRHELFVPGGGVTPLFQSFLGDTNLVSVSNLVQRTASGVVSANTNHLGSLFQIIEDPRTNGLYWGVQAADISPFGGTHASGQIVTLSGGMGVNPNNMVVTYITPPAAGAGPSSAGMFRNPLPMSDGTLIAAFTDAQAGTPAGVDTNIGTTTLPVSKYHFRLMTLTNAGGVWGTNQFITGGIQSTSIFWQGNILVTNSATLWELQPVEVRSRQIPVPVVAAVAPIEQQVFTEEGVDLPTFQADLAQRGLALVVSRNVTARDAADKQQPYNLQVPGGVGSVANSGKVYDITHLQFLQADYLRGYTNGPNGLPMPGRRILAVPMHATTNINYASSKTNAPPGGTEIMSDGSQATFIPANRAVTWQFTGDTNESVVKERYWISFRPGEVRTCANCHGINAADQVGHPSPTNAPFALRQLLRLWKTNAFNAYTLTVTNGSGGGNLGAGSIVTLTANPSPSGKAFVAWTGSPGIGNANSNVTSFIMPATNASVIAVYTNLPAPVFTTYFITNGTNFSLFAQAYANQSWILQSSTDLFNWVNLSTNTAAGNQLYQVGVPVNGAAVPKQYFRLMSP